MLRSIAFALAVAAAVPAFADDHTYQLTGTVAEVKKDSIVVQKGKEKNEYAIDASTKNDSGPKVGDKVTIEYVMVARKIVAKAAK